MGMLAAFALNDTVALMGPPIASAIARMAGIQHTVLYLLLAFSITVGSAATPLGNPQEHYGGCWERYAGTVRRVYHGPNLTNHSLPRPHRVHHAEALPRRDEPVTMLTIPGEHIVDRRDAYLAGSALAAAVLLLIGNDLLAVAGLPHVGRRGLIPFVVAAALYPFLRSPRETLQRVDWGTIVFFIAMFIAMEGVWQSGAVHIALTLLLPSKLGWPLEYVGIFAASLGLSQLVPTCPSPN
jgi:Na+/H+ antiporter NhaD/arsenite permease-like protein